MDVTPASHPRSISLSNLASALVTRFQWKGQLSDIDEAVEIHREALTLTPVSRPDRSMSLGNLAEALTTRYEKNSQLADLEDAIECRREALGLSPSPHPNRSRQLTSLANALVRRLKQKGHFFDLEEAITLYREALNLIPTSHPDCSNTLTNLAIALAERFERKDQLSDLEEAMDTFQRASVSESSPLLTRFRSSRTWARFADRYNHSSTQDAFQHAISFLLQLASLDVILQERYEILVQNRGLASQAFSWAVRSERMETAVEFFSAAQAVFWLQTLSLRTPLDELEAAEPLLGKKLRAISSELEHVSHWSLAPNADMRKVDKEAIRRRRLAEQWNSTLAEVRGRPSFEDFLLLKPFTKLRQAVSNGPVVLLNADASGCDGLVIYQDHVKHFPIQSLTFEEVTELGQITRAALESKGIRFDWTKFDVPIEADSDTIKTVAEQTSADSESYRKGHRIPDSGQTPEDRFRHVLSRLWYTVAWSIIDALNMKVMMLQVT